MMVTIGNFVSEKLAAELLAFYESKNATRTNITPGKSYYNKVLISGIDDVNLTEYMETLKKNNLINKDDMPYKKSWLNVITKDSNKNDPLHWDISKRTIITFLTDNFSGGEFEYAPIPYKKEVEIVKPKKLLSIAFDGGLFHRVLPVTSEGIRLTFVTFVGDPNTKS
jgi:hypothetical protein